MGQTDTKTRPPSKYEGADWLGRDLSPLGRKVADILGQVFLGIYHVNQRALDRVDWADPYCIAITLQDGLATCDFHRLTALVVLCHDAAIRMEISAATHGYLRLMFHQRTRDGGMCEGHPTIEDAVAMIHKRLSVEEVQHAD